MTSFISAHHPFLKPYKDSLFPSVCIQSAPKSLSDLSTSFYASPSFSRNLTFASHETCSVPPAASVAFLTRRAFLLILSSLTPFPRLRYSPAASATSGVSTAFTASPGPRSAPTPPASPLRRPSRGVLALDLLPGDPGALGVAPGDRVALRVQLGSTGARHGWRMSAGGEGQLLTFEVGGAGVSVIRGLQEGVLGMRVGGRRRLVIPPELGFRGRPGEQPVPEEFAAYQRFKNIYLNKNRQYVPDVVLDVELRRIVKRVAGR